MSLISDLRSLIGGVFQWDIRTQHGQLPAGAWLKRVASSGTIFDWRAPEYIHPLELLTWTKGRFGDDPEATRSNFQSLQEAMLTLKNFATFAGQALGLTPGRIVEWYWIFTPPMSPDPPKELEERVMVLARRQEQTWSDLGLPLEELQRVRTGLFQPLVLTPLPPATYRPHLWTEEINWR